MGAWSALAPRPSSSIRAFVFLVFGEVTPSWSSLTRGSAVWGLRLTTAAASLVPGLGLGLETEAAPGLEDSWSDGIFSLGLGADDDDDDEGLGVREEPGLPVDSLDVGPEMRAEPWPGLEPLWWSEEEDLGLGGAEGVLAVDKALGLGAVDDGAAAGLDTGLLVVGLRALLLSRSRRWLLYELRLGSLYRSTVRTFP